MANHIGYEEIWIRIYPCLVCSYYGCNEKKHDCDEKSLIWIRKARQIHGYKYDYSKVKFTRCGDKVTVSCIDHGDFAQKADGHVRKQFGCFKCASAERGKMKRCTIDECISFALEKDGKCLSPEYVNNHTDMLWECGKGHTWTARFGSIKNSNSWCPKCSKFRLTLEECQQIAISRGGECLSKEYVNNITKMLWRCQESHEWETTFDLIKRRGSWCPTCSDTKHTIEDCNRIAMERKGLCLSKDYVNAMEMLLWQCEYFHTWKQNYNNVVNNGSWCPCCSISKNYSKGQIEWLNYLSKSQNISIQHAENGGEYKIGKYKVDGFYEETKTVYEFHGDFYHGNPRFYNYSDINPVSKKTFGQLFKNTLHKEMYLRKMGYNYMCIWEHEWNLFEAEE